MEESSTTQVPSHRPSSCLNRHSTTAMSRTSCQSRAKGHKQERRQHTVRDEECQWDPQERRRSDGEHSLHHASTSQAFLGATLHGLWGLISTTTRSITSLSIGNRGWIGVKDRKVHSVIPKPASKSVAERLGLDDVNLNISLSEDTKRCSRVSSRQCRPRLTKHVQF